ncbi:metallophosphoesterase [Acanthopleuribacter pedis]|uniref:Metallophosphoesterase n=1 Tax=Acanthopleuribacter pedis TaxID=442870 RepID=A0A8J7U4G4_9BACT|nr:metallophosphoesterase [Acanthopleuribacter pedis]MBO1318261.1 metallophosphoesterase [Acanthopleuribacter pedis]
MSFKSFQFIFPHYRRMERWFGGIAQWWLPKQPELHEIRLTTPRLTAPVTLVQLSDLHCAAWTREDYIKATVGLCLDIQPDLMVWTGDFFHSARKQIARVMPLFSPLHQAIPTFGVLGNHDFDDVLDELLPLLTGCGITFLRGEQRLLTCNGQPVWLGGIDDFFICKRDVPAAYFEQDRAVFRLLLSHQPDVVFRLPEDAVDLMLSGHLHGGQLNFPLVGPLYLPSPRGREFLDGRLTRHRGVPVHVNVGLGYTLMPLRINCPPAISVIRLEPDVAGANRHNVDSR